MGMAHVDFGQWTKVEYRNKKQNWILPKKELGTAELGNYKRKYIRKFEIQCLNARLLQYN